jgi:hypothetical protein
MKNVHIYNSLLFSEYIVEDLSLDIPKLNAHNRSILLSPSLKSWEELRIQG